MPREPHAAVLMYATPWWWFGCSCGRWRARVAGTGEGYRRHALHVGDQP